MPGRDIYKRTMTLNDVGTGMLRALDGIQVAVYHKDSDVLATIYRRRDGVAQGPAPEVEAVGGPNPFTTGPSGGIEFWCDPDEYDIETSDAQVPPRITARRVGWNAVSASPLSLPSGWIAGDGELPLAALEAKVLEQMVPIGGVIEWWRPNSTVAPPSGFEIALGQSVPADEHEFPGVAGGINLPNLLNVFTIGADADKNNGVTSGLIDDASGAPGIGGVGGSNTGKNLGHSHGVPGVAHEHLGYSPDHLHGGVSYSGATGGANRITPWGTNISSGGQEQLAWGNHAHGFSGGSSLTGSRDRNWQFWTAGMNVGTSTGTNSTSWSANPGSDFRPRHIGLLKIMKVRREN